MKSLLFFLIFVAGLSPSAFSKVLYTYDWKGVEAKDTLEWLLGNGYEFQKNVEEMRPILKNDGLYLYPELDTFSALTYRVEVPGANRARITWGINRFHDKGDYSAGEFHEAFSVLFNFGYDKQPSGSIFIPDLPYFLNVIFGNREDPEKVYVGNYYHKGGRVICPGCGTDKAGRETMTEIDLRAFFKKSFPGVKYPKVTAFTLTTDLRDTSGSYEVYIKKIEFLD